MLQFHTQLLWSVLGVLRLCMVLMTGEVTTTVRFTACMHFRSHDVFLTANQLYANAR